MTVNSPAFKNNDPIPKQYTGFGEDVSPELVLDDVPNEAASIAIVLDDLDVPFTKEFTHWIIWNISPLTRIIPKAIPKGEVTDFPIRAIQGNAWGRHVYRGPKQPPFIRKAHRYRFSVYALDTVLDISPDSDKNMLSQALSDHVIAEAELIGIYDPAN